MSASERFEYATASDPALDYCLWSYAQPAPAEDKFRSINLLLQSLDVAGVDDRGLIEAIRDVAGPFRTVFGVKRIGPRLAWEFYFYDYARRARRVNAQALLDATRPWLGCTLRPDPATPYFMVSLDFDAELAAARRRLETIHIYVGTPGKFVSSGLAYALGERGAELENLYVFFDAATQMDEVVKKICSSPHFDESAASVETVLLPQLRQCRTICLANKRNCDCVYFSGIDVDQLIWFLENFDYPQPIVEFVRGHRARLDHLLFDVGHDYRLERSGLVTLKTGYYGVF